MSVTPEFSPAAPIALIYDVQGMDCPDCALKLEQAVSGVPGVQTAALNYTLARLEVTPAAGSDPNAAIQRVAGSLGYSVTPAASSLASGEPPTRSAWLRSHPREVLTALSGALIAVTAIASVLGAPAVAVQLGYALAVVAGGLLTAKAGVAAFIATRGPDMNLLMSVAVVGAAIIGEWAEAATVVFLFSLGNTLESLTMDRARGAIRKLMTLAPRTATRLVACMDCQEHLGQPLPLSDNAVYEGGPCPWCTEHQEQVQVDRLAVGDQILVHPAERVPADGTVLTGHSAVDQSPITGESMPVDKAQGDTLYAGTINGYGALTVCVSRLAADNTIARIIRLVEEAQSSKAPTQRYVDTFARYYTPAVMAGAAAIAVLPPLIGLGSLSEWTYRALVLLVIACPCALVISTPVSIVAALATAAHHGVLIKGGVFLEAAGNLRAVAFDKTGTLTRGRPVVTDVAGLAGDPPLSSDGVLALAAAVESHSEHPLARAVLAEALAKGVRYTPGADFTALPGQGASATVDGRRLFVGNPGLHANWLDHSGDNRERVRLLEADGKTVMMIGDERGADGLIAVADALRPESRDAVRALKAAGVSRTIMLTGDTPAAAAAMARASGVDEFRAGLMPADKLAAVQVLLDQYGHVAMVGDGVNDAPALARATVGIAMGAAGTDVALETADIALMGDDLTALPYAIGLSRQARAIIRQNIAFSLVVKGLFIALAIPGLATLWMAVFADMGASLLVTFNGLRLLRHRR